MSIPKFPDAKDPDDITDFTLSFAEAMPFDDIIMTMEQTVVVPSNVGEVPPSTAPDVSVPSQLFSGQNAILWLAGGKGSWRYQVSVLVHTAGGRTLGRRVMLNVKML